LAAGGARAAAGDAGDWVPQRLSVGAEVDGRVPAGPLRNREEGRNVAVEYRWSDSDYDRLPALAANLIECRVAVIVAAGVDPAHAAKTATTTIPIVFFMSGDPVAENLVSSLNQPSSNLTGVTTFAGVLTSKRLELLRELAPSAKIAALMNPNNSNAKFRLKEIEEASRILDLRVEIVETRNADEIDGAFTSLLQRGAGALLVVDDPLFHARSELVALAMRTGFQRCTTKANLCRSVD
jgi:putative ABC transport system substrate-binding protein